MEAFHALVEADKGALGLGELLGGGSHVAVAEKAVGDGRGGEVVTDKGTGGENAREVFFLGEEPVEDVAVGERCCGRVLEQVQGRVEVG